VPDAAPADAWFLHSRGRTVGPLTASALRDYFVAGMVRPVDTVVAPEQGEPLTAAVAAERLGAPPVAPPPAPMVPAVPLVAGARAAPAAGALPSTPTPSSAGVAPVATRVPPRPTLVVTRDASLGWMPIALWTAVLFAVQLIVLPRSVFSSRPSMPLFLGTALMLFGLVVGASLLLAALVRSTRGRQAFDAHWTLSLASVVFAGWLVFRTLVPETVPAAAMQTARQQGWIAGSGEDGEFSQSLFVQAKDLANRKDWEGLRTLATRWAQSDPGDPNAYMWLAASNAKLGDRPQTIRALESMRELVPREVWTLEHLGWERFKDRDYFEAAKHYEALTTLEPRNAEHWRMLGDSKYSGGDNVAANAAYTRTVALEPDNFRVWMRLYHVRKAVGDEAGMQEANDRWLALGGKARELREAEAEKAQAEKAAAR
jgi:hypothetical protein